MTPDTLARIAAAIDADLVNIDGWRGVRPERVKLHIGLARSCIALETARQIRPENAATVQRALVAWHAALAALAPDADAGAAG